MKEQSNRGGKLWCRNGDKSSEGLVALSQWGGSVRGVATPWAPASLIMCSCTVAALHAERLLHQ